MESKYYLPTIDEFHVGFEYEQHEIVNELDPHWKMMVKKMGFSKKEINQIFYNVDLIDNLDQKRIRVKYLDKEDIESLGFKYYDKIEDSIYFKYKSFRLAFNPIVNKVEIVELGPCHFRGSIKNKSELNVVLKQIGIVNE